MVEDKMKFVEFSVVFGWQLETKNLHQLLPHATAYFLIYKRTF